MTEPRSETRPDFPPLTDADLQSLKDRMARVADARYVFCTRVSEPEGCLHVVKEVANRKVPVGDEDVLAVTEAVTQLPRLLAEIERLRDENESLLDVIGDAYQSLELEEPAIAREQLYPVLHDRA